MTTVIRPFKLARKSLSADARAVSKSVLKLAPRAASQEPLVDPLADWHPGFSSRAATDHLESLGTVMPARPPTDPQMPDDITSVASDYLGMLHAQFVSYTEYLEAQLALAEIDADEQESYLEHVEAEIRLRKAGTVKDKDSKTKNDLRYIAAEQTALTAKARAKLLKARTRGYERCAAALSREMTRRAPVARTD